MFPLFGGHGKPVFLNDVQLNLTSYTLYVDFYGASMELKCSLEKQSKSKANSNYVTDCKLYGIKFLGQLAWLVLWTFKWLTVFETWLSSEC